VQLHDSVLDDVAAEEAVLVEKVGARLVEGRFTPLLGLSVNEGKVQLVHVVKPDVRKESTLPG
jgi:hypothetical protein